MSVVLFLRRVPAVARILLGVACLGIPPALSDESIRADCHAYVQPAQQLSYDNNQHRLWYERFWTGKCEGLPFFACLSGQPDWNDTISSLIGRVSTDQRDAVLAEACKVGELVGYEWAKDNNTRCIATSDVEKWGGTLGKSADVLGALAQIKQDALARLGCREGAATE